MVRFTLFIIFSHKGLKGFKHKYQAKGGILMSLPIASVEKLIRKAGAHRVSKGAAKELASYLEKEAAKIAREAVTLAEHAGRKTVRTEDIRLIRTHGRRHWM